jgi:sterol desaturase/sphingolipid hydroxylase (fatty acid hydroxylase superfamily)
MYYLPLALIGFHPLAILVQASISLLYQFWIHTETIGRLGWLEKVLNTPSHHRVHHGSNACYLDRNYGGILIIWDRLFGTFQEERADTPVRYGLVRDIHTYNPLRVIFHELAYLLRQAWQAPRWREKLGWVLLPPEWKPQPRE